MESRENKPAEKAASRGDGRREIVSLTILRAFASWWVVIYHFRKMSPYTSGLDIFVLNFGWVGVDIFFVLSGFVLAYVYGPSIEGQNFDFWQFLVKRFARIYPVHLLTLALTVAIATALLAVNPKASLAAQLFANSGTGYDPVRTILAQLLLIHAWGVEKIGHFNAPSWSISAEWFAYLFFPVVAYAILRLSRTAAVATGIIVFLLFNAFALAWLGVPLAGLNENFGILRIMPEFCLGIAAFMLFRTVRIRRHWALLLLLAAVSGFYLQYLFGNGLWLIAPLAFFLVLCVSWLDAFLPQDAKVTRLLRYLGEISYSTYMVHTIVLILIWPLFTRFGARGWQVQSLLFVLAGLMVAAASSALYHWVEIPARNWISAHAPRISRTRN